MTYKNRNSILKIAIFFAMLALFPYTTSADYSFNGKQFDTYEDYSRYVTAYMQAWRIAYGYEEDETNTSSSRAFSIKTSLTKDVSKESVRMTGRLDFNASKRVRIWFDYGKSKRSLTERTTTEVLDESRNSNAFDRKVFDLEDNTVYYYRAAGLDEKGTVRYGNIHSFTTDVDPSNTDSNIRVRTGRASDIDEDRATLRARVSFKREKIAVVWFEYGDDEDDLYKQTSANYAVKGDGNNVYKTIRRLRDSTTYYFRPVGEDVAGERSYGKIYSFTTQKDVEDETPEVITQRYSDVSSHSAVVGGSVDMNDFRNGIVFVLYGEDRDKIQDTVERYSRYKKIRERGDDIQKLILDDDLDRFKTFQKEINYLDLDTKHYYTIGVEYENIDGDEEIEYGRLRSLKTKRG